MRVLVIPANSRNIHPMDIDGTLAAMQELVGGYIECAAPAQLREMGIQLIVNEEGLLAGLPVNENLWPFFFVGHAFMVGADGEDFTSLSDPQLRYAISWLHGLT